MKLKAQVTSLICRIYYYTLHTHAVCYADLNDISLLIGGVNPVFPALMLMCANKLLAHLQCENRISKTPATEAEHMKQYTAPIFL